MKVFFNMQDLNKYLKEEAKDGETVRLDERGFKVYMKKRKEVKK